MQAIVDTHEASITPDTPLDKIDGYTIEQVRQAERLVVDGRSETTIHSSPGTLNANPTIATFRHMVRGVRWMNANMLDWNNPNTIMPEQLDNKSLPPAPPTALSGGN